MPMTDEEDKAPNSPNYTTDLRPGFVEKPSDSSDFRHNATASFTNIVVASITQALPPTQHDASSGRPRILVRNEWKENIPGSFREPFRTAVKERFHRFGTRDPREVLEWNRQLRYWQLATSLPRFLEQEDEPSNDERNDRQNNDENQKGATVDSGQHAEGSSHQADNSPAVIHPGMPQYPHQHLPPQPPYSAPPHIPEGI